ncbi:hypothetical protein [Kangiella geojedonensis]|uniref:Lipoprotein n=1 Tax=Kangiella geojedonensis TaxID=914150 RepID=A0A0F6TSH8_9GAMM|nr:hypothetical protein [Kangiella geojedonensis]AKE53069.1 hypothetical protein TQ33_2142 [Kangiella geojedonensis]
MRRVLLLGLLILLSACTNKYKQLEAIKITISHEIPYENPQEVAENVKTECFDLEMNLSKFISLHGKDFNIDVVRSHDLSNLKEGLVFDLQISNVYSGRGMYHNKNMMLKGDLYRDGKLVDKFAASRDSNGGMFSLMRSSCSVLDKTASALAKDANVWLRSKLK